MTLFLVGKMIGIGSMSNWLKLFVLYLHVGVNRTRYRCYSDIKTSQYFCN